jgi:hypothetical protein
MEKTSILGNGNEENDMSRKKSLEKNGVVVRVGVNGDSDAIFASCDRSVSDAKKNGFLRGFVR